MACSTRTKSSPQCHFALPLGVCLTDGAGRLDTSPEEPPSHWKQWESDACRWRFWEHTIDREDFPGGQSHVRKFAATERVLP